jgi:divalent metal cation (Fe/Co/Zn/Cd) transporter
MDTALPIEDQNKIQKILETFIKDGVQTHALRTRRSGTRQFVSLHVLVPGRWTVHRGHELLERIEMDIRQALPEVTIFTHMEPLNDPTSWDDTYLDRVKTPPVDEQEKP